MKRYGWIPDLPDHRDFVYQAPPGLLQALPSQIDLRPGCPPPYDQGHLGSCTANAIAAAHEFEQRKQNKKAAFTPSRLFIYFNERTIEHHVQEDSGGMLRDGMKTVAQQGVCPEKIWPYRIERFVKKPSARCYKEALNHQVVSYRRLVQTLEQMKGCLASGFPFVFGFSVYESFESPAVAQTGNVPMPSAGESMLGGHAVMAVGYDEDNQQFWVRNSWGAKWGMNGYCLMPYEYLTHPDLAADFWTIRLVEVESN